MAQKKAPKRKKKIIFVCTGNTCRSPMAEYIFKYILRKKRKLSLYDISSAGICANEGEPMTQNAALALKNMGISVKGTHKAKRLTRDAVQNADLVVCMTGEHKAVMDGWGEKIQTVGEITGISDVPDPYGGDLQTYAKTAQYLLYACEDIYDRAAALPVPDR